VPLKQVLSSGASPLPPVLDPDSRRDELAHLSFDRSCCFDCKAGRWRRIRSGAHPDLRGGSLDVTGRRGRLLSADRCPSDKHCPCGGRGVVGVGKVAHLIGELLVSVSAHIVVVEQVSNRARQVPSAAPTPIGDIGGRPSARRSQASKRRPRSAPRAASSPTQPERRPVVALLIRELTTKDDFG
jgi:hypothetical protein